MPVHTVESIVRHLLSMSALRLNILYCQLVSVISLLSSDKPNLDSPANVDAAKEVRTEFESTFLFHL
jgi:hypothetical protein